MLFAMVDDEAATRLEADGLLFYRISPGVIRLVTSWQTTDAISTRPWHGSPARSVRDHVATWLSRPTHYESESRLPPADRFLPSDTHPSE